MARKASAWARLTHPLRALPSFLGIGGQKCGTTSLYWMMAEHPQFRRPCRKEIHYFDRYYRHGMGWYRSHFPLRRELAAAPGGVPCITGETTPNYLFHPYAAQRAAATVPDARLILLLRDPVDRAYSHYQMHFREGRTTRTFAESLAYEEEILPAEREKMQQDPAYYSEPHRLYSYFARGIYLPQIEEWLRYYPRERLLIIPSSDFRRDTAGTMNRIFAYLGLPPHPVEAAGNRRVAEYDPLCPRLRAELKERYRPHNEALFNFLGQDLGWN